MYNFLNNFLRNTCQPTYIKIPTKSNFLLENEKKNNFANFDPITTLRKVLKFYVIFKEKKSKVALTNHIIKLFLKCKNMYCLKSCIDATNLSFLQYILI